MQDRQDAPRGQGGQPLALRLNDQLGVIVASKCGYEFIRLHEPHKLINCFAVRLPQRIQIQELRSNSLILLVKTRDQAAAVFGRIEINLEDIAMDKAIPFDYQLQQCLSVRVSLLGSGL